MSSLNSPLYNCDNYRAPCDSTSASDAACDGHHHKKRGAMRVTLRKAVQGSALIACIFFFNFIYFNAYLIQWRQGFLGGLSSSSASSWQVQQKQHRFHNRDVEDLRIEAPGSNIGVDYEAVVIPGRDLHGVTGAPLKIWNILGDPVVVPRRLPNFFWRSNRPVDSGDTRSLLDLQTRKKKRRASTKVIYEHQSEEGQVPLLDVVPGITLKRRRGALQQQQQGSYSYVQKMDKIRSSPKRNTDDNHKNTLLDRLNPTSKLIQSLKFRQSLIIPHSPSSSSTPSLSSSSSSSSSTSSSVSSSSSSLSSVQINERPTTLNDIFISVKTTQKFHEKRLKLVLDTWFQFAKDQTYFFTDTNDNELTKRTNNHMINTNCSAVHNRQALCCKMAQEYDTFMESKKRWFCHVDDDTYVNVPKLVTVLQKYNHTKDWYLGKPSLRHPIEIMDRDNPGQKISFWFATGGAGFCISRSLALKMMPHAGDGRLMTVGEKIRLPDDCTVGYIIGHILKKQLTIVDSFHSHLEALWLLRPFDLDRQVTFSYSKYGEKMNIVNVPGFSNKEDPTRLWSIHCHLFPYLRECRSLQ